MRFDKRNSVALVVAMMSSGCAHGPPLVAIRTDGQPIPGNPVLNQTFALDRQICEGEKQKAHMAGGIIYGGGLGTAIAVGIEREQRANQVMSGCMAQKGYVQVPENEVAAKLAEFKANAALAAVGPPTSQVATGSVASSK